MEIFSRLKKRLNPILQIARQTEICNLSAHSGESAFFFMLSFFPFLLFLFAILRLTPLTEETLSLFLLSYIPASFRDFMSSLIHDIYAASSGQILSLSIVSAVWLSSKAFLSLVRGLNDMYSQDETRNYIILRLFSLVYSILFALLLIAALALLVFGNWIQAHILNDIPLISAISGQIINMRLVIGFLPLFCFFLLLYHFLPDHGRHAKDNLRWKLHWHIPGASLATVGWLLLSWLYSYYVDYFSNYSTFYGTMTTIALLMVWLYACMYILLFGGILNNYLRQIDHQTSL